MRAYLLRRRSYLEFQNEVSRVLDHFEGNALVEEVICEISPETARLIERGTLDLELFPEEDKKLVGPLLDEIKKGKVTVGWLPDE
ncbi:hypothetical protein [Thermococcus sp.]|uniref:hypothetical protein n=1 Tax=Thermococcus sp. TaxID=35749 RepID=UPI002615BD3E|nr:hypothetical protein [Thermococcus sp.]